MAFAFDSTTFTDLVAKHPLPAGVTFKYGTAGFRTDASTLDGVTFRVGILASLRAQSLGQNVGVCITASHNAAVDNGVKIVDGTGEMLQASWESHATLLANAQDASAIAAIIKNMCAEFNITINPDNSKYCVLIARDTRPSGAGLSQAAMDGCASVGQASYDYGVQTTPQCHFCVRESNLRPAAGLPDFVPEYEAQLISAFHQLLSGKKDSEPTNTNAKVLIDCANGVGTQVLLPLQQKLKGTLDIQLYNADTSDPAILNHECGADFVQKEQVAPKGTPATDPAVHLCTIDGDADRVVYFQQDAAGKFKLLDGDKIITLYAIFIKKQLDILGLTSEDVNMGVVQTAYANGGSTRYITGELKLNADCTPTGVKHLHHKALEYDIGVYFEANGHGTTVFQDKVLSLLEKFTPTSPEQEAAVTRLLASSKLLHPTVGDAIGDLLMVEGCLFLLGWDSEAWQNVYTDLPSRQTKVSVPDPKRVTTIWDETKTLTPEGMQEKIDAIVNKYDPSTGARAFVRPSGTEPVVRIYAEGATPEAVEGLTTEIKAVLIEMLP